MGIEHKDIYQNPLENAVGAFNTVMAGNSLGRVHFGKPRTLEELKENHYVECYYRDSEGNEAEVRLIVSDEKNGKFTLRANRGKAEALEEVSAELSGLGVNIVHLEEHPGAILEHNN